MRCTALIVLASSFLLAAPAATPAAPAHPSPPWFTWHQADDGSWPIASYPKICVLGGACVRQAGASDDDTPAGTALVCMMLTGTGTTLSRGRYMEPFKKGIAYLTKIQDESGRVGPEHDDGRHRYNHVLTTMSLCEAYGMAGFPAELKDPTQRAVDWLCAQQRDDGSWPYGPDPKQGDAPLAIWSLLTLKSAQLSRLTVPDQTVERALTWLESLRDDDGMVGWRAKGDTGARPAGCRWSTTPKCVRAGVAAVRIFHKKGPDDPAIVETGEWLRKNLLSADEPDAMYAYWGTLTAFQIGRDTWREWAGAFDEAVSTKARYAHGTCASGTWDPEKDPFGAEGGLVYTSTINTMADAIARRFPIRNKAK